jgi:hypothetical protein
MEDAQAAASRLFKTRDGEVVLEYLKSRYYDNKIHDDNVLRQVGQRDVILSILNMVENKYGTNK